MSRGAHESAAADRAQPHGRGPACGLKRTAAAGLLASGLGLFLLGGVACTGDSGESTGADASPSQLAIDPGLAATTWPVRMAVAETRAPFEAHAGWAHLFQRQHGQALAAFSAEAGDGRGLARTHLELAALYRQAALMGARSAIHTFGELRVDEDPAAVDYLVGVGAIFDGDVERGRTAFTALGTAGPPELQAAADGWRAWLDAGATWPPDADLSAVPSQLGDVKPGTLPDFGPLTHYELVENSDEARSMAVGDPSALWLLSRWHEAAALQSAPNDAALMAVVLRPWQLPAEPTDALVPVTEVTDAWLFGGFVLAPADLGFLAQASTDGVAAVTAHQAASPLAACIAPAIVDGQVVPDRMLDQAAWLGQQLEADMVVASGGEEGFHQPFSQVARVAALRAAMMVADANGQYRDAGVLRINALDRTIDAAADPVFLASVAAWDAGNKNALRAQEIVHRVSKRYPEIQAARTSLDSLHIRVSRNAAPAAPVH